MSFAVYLEQSLVVGFDDVDVERVTFGTFRMKGTTTVVVVAGHSHSQHISTQRTVVHVLAISIDQMQSFD